jgi:hypothetical protein
MKVSYIIVLEAKVVRVLLLNSVYEGRGQKSTDYKAFMPFRVLRAPKGRTKVPIT